MNTPILNKIKSQDMSSKKIILSPLFKALFIGLLILASYQVKAQQQFSFTQYMDNLTPVNSAYSLLQPGGSIHTTVRKQWVGIPGAPSTYLVNGSLPIESINASAGLIAMNDSYTVEHQTEVDAFFAKAIKLTAQNNLAVSINAGFRNYVANYSQLSSTDNAFKNDIRETTPNLGFAVMFYSNSYYIGLSAPELNIRSLGLASQQDSYDFKSNYYLSGGFASGLGDDFKFKYAGLVSYTQGMPLIADVSAIAVVKEQVSFGVDVRTNKEVAGIFSVNYDVFHIGYSYQFGTTSSNIAGFSNATQEITLAVHFGKTTK